MVGFLQNACPIIQDVAVELAHRDNDLRWMAVRRLRNDHPCNEIAQRSPCKLCKVLV